MATARVKKVILVYDDRQVELDPATSEIILIGSDAAFMKLAGIGPTSAAGVTLSTLKVGTHGVLKVTMAAANSSDPGTPAWWFNGSQWIHPLD